MRPVRILPMKHTSMPSHKRPRSPALHDLRNSLIRKIIPPHVPGESMQPPSTHHVSERVRVDKTQSILSTADHNHLTVHSMVWEAFPSSNTWAEKYNSSCTREPAFTRKRILKSSQYQIEYSIRSEYFVQPHSNSSGVWKGQSGRNSSIHPLLMIITKP